MNNSCWIVAAINILIDCVARLCVLCRTGALCSSLCACIMVWPVVKAWWAVDSCNFLLTLPSRILAWYGVWCIGTAHGHSQLTASHERVDTPAEWCHQQCVCCHGEGRHGNGAAWYFAHICRCVSCSQYDTTASYQFCGMYPVLPWLGNSYFIFLSLGGATSICVMDCRWMWRCVSVSDDWCVLCLYSMTAALCWPPRTQCHLT